MAEAPYIILMPASWMDGSKWEALLGAVVRNYSSPTHDCVPENPLRYNKERQYDQDPFADFVLEHAGSRGEAAGLKLQSRAKVVWRGDLDSSFDLSGKHLHYIQLREIERYWRDLKKDPDVRVTVPQWLGSAALSDPYVCLVTGVFICEDVEIEQSSEAAAEREREGEKPLGVVESTVESTQSIPVARDIGDGTAEASDSRPYVPYFRASERQASIFALQLKRVTAPGFDRTESQLRDKSVPSYRLMGDDNDVPPVEALVLEDFDPTLVISEG